MAVITLKIIFVKFREVQCLAFVYCKFCVRSCDAKKTAEYFTLTLYIVGVYGSLTYFLNWSFSSHILRIALKYGYDGTTINSNLWISEEKRKEEIWLSPMTEALTPTEKSKKQCDNTKNATKNFDYTTIADRLRTVSWGNDSHPAGVVKPVYGIPTFPLTAKAV